MRVYTRLYPNTVIGVIEGVVKGKTISEEEAKRICRQITSEIFKLIHNDMNVNYSACVQLLINAPLQWAKLIVEAHAIAIRYALPYDSRSAKVFKAWKRCLETNCIKLPEVRPPQ